MDLKAYDRAKFELAELLRSVALLATSPDQKKRIEECFVRLAEDRFNLVVVGRFSRGKTSLMNAILGTDRLPVGIVPLTSVITSVAYGSKEQVTIRFQDRRRFALEIPLHALPEYITQQHNPGNARQVSTAEVKLPAEILRRGFYFVDTPGLGSPIPENTRTTEEFLPEADAFVLVTSFESPLSEEELRILRAASASARRVFVVVNKLDSVSADERDQALDFVREQLSTAVGGRAPEVFAISARQGLEARKSGDAVRLAASGIEAFEAELIRFLLAEKSREFLLRLCDRVMDLIYELPPQAETKRLDEGVAALTRQIAGDSPDVQLREGTPATDVTPRAGQQPGSCAICAAIVEAEFEFLRHYQYALSIRPQMQREHAERGGFCSLHTWQYGILASSQGICTSYPALLEHLSERFHRLATARLTPQALSSALLAVLPTAQNCVLCGERAKAEREAILSLAGELGRSAETDWKSLSVICLPHLRLLIAAIDDAETIRKLLVRESAILDRLAEDMRRYAMKRDAIRRGLINDEENHADLRALSALAGLRNVNRVGGAGE